MGANSGIGEAVAHQLAKQPDHHVVIAARNLEASAEVVADLVATGHSTSSVQLVLSSDKSIAKTAQRVRYIHGKLDVLVNNAGGGVDQVPGLTTREIFTQESELNVTGPAILTDAFLLLLTNSAAPRVVFVSSSLASIGMSCDKASPLYNPGYKAKGYGSIKAALNGLVSHYSQLLTDAGLIRHNEADRLR